MNFNFKLRFEKAHNISTFREFYLASLLAVIFMLLIGTALFAVLGYPPLQTVYAYFLVPFESVYGITEVLLKATTLALIGIGLSVGFQANVWNIGAEGQFVVGALFGSFVALFFYDSTGWWVMLLALFAGALGGMLWACIPAFFKTRFNANEVLTSLMLVYVAQFLHSYLIHGLLKDPQGYNFPQSKLFQSNAVLPILVEGTRLNILSIFLVLVVILALVWQKRHFGGFQLKAMGLAPLAAKFAGFKANHAVWVSFIVGGLLAGLAGSGEVLGPIGQLTAFISPGYGFTAIIVAFLGRLQPLGIVLAAILLALVHMGGENAQIDLGLPVAISGIFQGLVLFCLLGADFFAKHRIKKTQPSK